MMVKLILGSISIYVQHGRRFHNKHGFIHTLQTIPKNWYLEMELRHGIMNWEDMVYGFILTFSFEDDFPFIDLALQTVKKNIFKNVKPLTWQQPDWAV